MEYSIRDVSKMAGVSPRTLRYYDEIGLLRPSRMSSNGYRVYGDVEINRLQQILFYREFELPLEKIAEIMSSENYDREKALMEHKEKLILKRSQIDQMLINLNSSIREMKGEIVMKDQDKFQGLKEKNLKVNEEKYGKELREKYGEAVIIKSNRKYQNQSQETYEKAERLGALIMEKLHAAMETKDPSSEEAQEVARLHKEWISIYWPVYDKEAHRGLGEMYVADERFKAYYDQNKEGAAEFLRDSINLFTK